MENRLAERTFPRRRGFLCAVLSFPLLVFGGLRQAFGSVAPFVLIVNRENRIDSATRDFLEQAFLKKTTRWNDDEPIRPVDLAPASPVRRAFSERILRRSVEAVKNYWQQRIFSGRAVPPPELDSDREVVAYVAKHRGGIGYVSPDTDPSPNKRIIVRG